MLKVAPCTVARSYGRTVVQSYGRTTKFFRLDGLLLFCIVMGLRSASSAIMETFYNDIVVGELNDDSESSNFSDVINLLMSHF